jgi:hypothetical protein
MPFGSRTSCGDVHVCAVCGCQADGHGRGRDSHAALQHGLRPLDLDLAHGDAPDPIAEVKTESFSARRNRMNVRQRVGPLRGGYGR